MNTYLNRFRQHAASVAALILVTAGATTSHAVTPPTLTITAPKTGEKWSNALFTVTGTVKAGTDALSNVLVSVNSGAWTNATIVSNKTWSVHVSLTPGTNHIDAYAVDIAGHRSTTNKVALFYVLTSPLTITITGGAGTVTGATNGQPLDVNVGHTLTAKAGIGFAFEYYIDDGIYVTNSKLSFIMTEGLVIIVHFKDITPPTLTITSPTTGQRDSNDTINVTGTASDNVAVTAVQVRMNGGAWTNASGTTGWSVILPVALGSNTVDAYAVDGAGNVSKTNSVNFLGLTPSQVTYAPTSIAGKVVILTPEFPAPLPPHILGFSAAKFSYADTNRTADDSGVGNYGYGFIDTNFSEIQMGFTAPPTNNGVAMGIDLTFTNFNIGTFSNLLTGETGPFVIQDTPVLVPASFSGKTYTGLTLGTSQTNTITFGTGTYKVTSPGGQGQSGTYTVFTASPIGAFFALDFAQGPNTGTIYLEVTFTGPSVGIYEINDYVNGSFRTTDCGTFFP